jgi:hypothetical protein
VPTAASWTEVRRAVQDVAHLIRFRSTTVRRRRALVVAVAVFGGMTTAAAVVPAFVPGAGSNEGYAIEAMVLLPAAMAGLLALAVASAVASGGGRELLSREHAVAYPVSPTTDHLGAFLLAPLNIAWLIQAWVLLGATAYGAPRESLVPAQLGILLWIATATAVGQVAAWTVEAVKRGPHGVLFVRAAGVSLAAVAVGIQLSGNTARVLDSLQTRWLVVGFVDGFNLRWAASMGVELGLFVLALVLGAIPAHLAARRPPKDEVRIETGNHAARAMPSSMFAALVRIDRGSVWRAVPMRRGVAVLAIGPGLVALAGDLTWSQMTILPGLVASGGALLFGVNAWCLDHRGGLWRESLPVGPATVFGARAWVLAEFLLVASLTTIVLAGLRAGVPTAGELAALLCILTVVVLQVLSSAMRWSALRPFNVDLRSARATPAPPVVMVGYSTKLAVVTTMTSLVFSGLARLDAWQASVLVATPFVAWSVVRLLHARDTWVDPVSRARVVTTVAA